MLLPSLANLPADFLWGAATSAYQIEGASREGRRSASVWDTFAHTPGSTRHGDTGDVACDHWHRWPEDLDLAAELGLGAYRFSLAWSRLQPSGRGALDPEALRTYSEMLEGMRSRGLRPFLTLYHWDLPQALEDEGGWTSRSTAHAFADYVGQVAQALGDLVADWITVNEPWCAAILGYGLGAHAPGRRDPRAAVSAAHHLNLAHGLAVREIRRRRPGARIGASHLIADLVPADPESDRAAVARLDAVNHQLFLTPLFDGSYGPDVHELLDRFGLAAAVQDGDLELISAPLDFLGVNHYQQVVVRDGDDGLASVHEEPAGTGRTSFGWSISPDALTSVLRGVHERYTRLPIYVTENGASFNDYVTPDGQVHDLERVDYITRYAKALDDAAAAGVPVAGYFVWSLLDNFEWAEGYDKRFGLIWVDFGDQRRIPKDSFARYQQIIAGHRGSRSPQPAVAAHV
ncbi:MAG: GH1 family beta-glucosidase [Motilibacteraceae bacterium]